MTVLHGEVLTEAGECCVILGGLQGKQTDHHRLPRGASGFLLPRFSWKGFQYAQVTLQGAQFKSTEASFLLASVRGLNTATDLEESEIRFHGKEARVFNGLASITRNSQRSNLAAYIPTDCPTREKRGWLGDSLNTVGNAMTSTFTPTLFTNFLNLIRDDQEFDKSSALHGWIPSALPAPAVSLGDISWMAAYPIEANLMRRHFGDLRVAADHWPSLTLWTDAVIGKGEAVHKACTTCASEAGGLPDFFTWGDWCSAEARANATPHTGRPLAAANMLLALEAMVEMATALGKERDAAKYAAAHERYSIVFHSRFYNASTGVYNADTNDPLVTQSINAAALAAGVVPSAAKHVVVDALKRDVAKRGLSVGATGATHLLGQLAKNGRNDVAASLAASTSYPSWGNWLLRNATTCWESWSGVADASHPPVPTHNHIFLCGGLGEYLYKDLAGITPLADGYSLVAIAPRAPLPASIDSVSAAVRTVRGTVSSSWQVLAKQGFKLEASVPVHMAADVLLPLREQKAEAATVMLDGDVVFKAGLCQRSLPTGVTSCQAEEGALRFRVTSGVYVFELQPSVLLYV